jgi:hypothetical protein
METQMACRVQESVLPVGACQGTIVIVEDPFIQKYLRSVLARSGLRSIGSDARTAAGMLGLAVERVDLVITNSPRDFLAFAGTLPLLYVAGAPDPELASQFRRCRLLRKPFHPDQLVALVKDLAASV